MYLASMQGVFEEMDSKDQGTITLEEFESMQGFCPRGEEKGGEGPEEREGEGEAEGRIIK